MNHQCGNKNEKSSKYKFFNFNRTFVNQVNRKLPIFQKIRNQLMKEKNFAHLKPNYSFLDRNKINSNLLKAKKN